MCSHVNVPSFTLIADDDHPPPCTIDRAKQKPIFAVDETYARTTASPVAVERKIKANPFAPGRLAERHLGRTAGRKDCRGKIIPEKLGGRRGGSGVFRRAGASSNLTDWRADRLRQSNQPTGC
jgi:hypothetical protein